jgi:peptide/nickel transport system ATP-binding protein
VLCRDLGMSVIVVTHDIGVVAETCDRAAVMYCGRLVESCTWPALRRPSPRGAGADPVGGFLMCPWPIIEVVDVAKSFPLGREGLLGRRKTLRTLAGVNHTVVEGEALGIVGESRVREVDAGARDGPPAQNWRARPLARTSWWSGGDSNL